MVNISTLINLLKLKKNKIYDFVTGMLPKKYTVYKEKNFAFYVPKNPVPIMLVAHIDTVGGDKDKKIIYTKKGIIYNKKGILGADDRAGIYGILKVINITRIQPYILLTDLEESGGIGAKDFCAAYSNKLSGINLMIELDRTGCNEYVTYNHLPDEVKKYIHSFGFRSDFGSYSDIYDLSKEFKIPSVNLSVGYYYEHTANEYLVVDELNLTINKLSRILRNPIKNLYEIKEEELSYLYDFYIDEEEEEDYWTLEEELEQYKEELIYFGIIDNRDKCAYCNLPYKNCICGAIIDAIEVIKEKNKLKKGGEK